MPYICAFSVLTKAKSISGSERKYDCKAPIQNEDIWLSLVTHMVIGAVKFTLITGTRFEKIEICASCRLMITLKSTGVRGISSNMALRTGESCTRSIRSRCDYICLTSNWFIPLFLVISLFLYAEFILLNSWSISLIASSVRFSSPEISPRSWFNGLALIPSRGTLIVALEYLNCDKGLLAVLLPISCVTPSQTWLSLLCALRSRFCELLYCIFFTYASRSARLDQRYLSIT